MGVLYQYFAAGSDEDAAATIDVEGGPGGPEPVSPELQAAIRAGDRAAMSRLMRPRVRFSEQGLPVLAVKGVDPVVQMGTLEELPVVVDSWSSLDPSRVTARTRFGAALQAEVGAAWSVAARLALRSAAGVQELSSALFSLLRLPVASSAVSSSSEEAADHGGQHRAGQDQTRSPDHALQSAAMPTQRPELGHEIVWIIGVDPDPDGSVGWEADLPTANLGLTLGPSDLVSHMHGVAVASLVHRLVDDCLDR
ncbi:hypothetical protein ACWD69_32860 [Micromonospora chokoriensis]